jgi:pilus assembly protein Flp/PilA
MHLMRAEVHPMKQTVLKFYVKIQVIKDALIREESGQDLVEYALVIALIALGATASMTTLAGAFSTAFGKVGTKLATYTS